MWSHQIRLSSVKSRWKSHTVGPGNIPRTPPPNLCWSSAECCHISVSLMRLKLSTSFTYSALIGVFFLFFSPFPVIATLQAHGEVYKYERRVSMYDFFFSPFQAQRACQSFIAEIFQELLSSIFLFPYLTGVENNYVPPFHKDGKK